MTGKDFVEILKYMDGNTLEAIIDHLEDINENLEQLNREIKKLSNDNQHKKYIQQELPF